MEDDINSSSQQIASVQQSSLLNIFYKNMTKLNVEVFYEEGSAPYTGTSTFGKDYWNLFVVNIEKILNTSNRSIQTNFQTQVNEMSSFSSRNKETWNTIELKSLFNELGAGESIDTTGVLSILFVSGYFEDSSGNRQENVLGIHMTGTTQIIIFKDLIKKINEDENTWVARFSEQSVLIHEVGHALGLVNNGLPMSSSSEGHQDNEHGHHCSNEKCVMYWLNEGRDGLKNFIYEYVSTGNEIIFDQQCLDDAADYSL